MKPTFARILGIVAAVALWSAGSVLRAGQSSSKVDVTGAWAFIVESAAGTGMPTVTFKQSGEQLAGHYSSMFFGEA